MKSKKEIMAKMRADRKARGLVRFEAYVTPKTRQKLKDLADREAK